MKKIFKTCFFQLLIFYMLNIFVHTSYPLEIPIFPSILEIHQYLPSNNLE